MVKVLIKEFDNMNKVNNGDAEKLLKLGEMYEEGSGV